MQLGDGAAITHHPRGCGVDIYDKWAVLRTSRGVLADRRAACPGALLTEIERDLGDGVYINIAKQALVYGCKAHGGTV